MLCLAPGSRPAQAQEVTTLIPFTNVWKYDQSGLELGTAWRTNDYDDSAWLSGPGLLGLEPDTPQTYTIHAPISTPLTISSTVTTFYFRTTFDFTGGVAGLSLIATNLVDDGCAIYLNGLRVGGVRILPGYNAPNAAQFFAGGTEGALEVVTFANLSALRTGANLLAVEVHQSASTSADVMWGMRLLSIVPTQLVITTNLQDVTAVRGNTATFRVGVSGGPVTYRWYRGTTLQSSTSNTLNFPNVQAGSAGTNYYVVVSNIVNMVTSRVATLTVVADTDGPKLVQAILNNTPPGGTPYPTNTINVFFDEQLNGTPGTNATSALNTNNYVLVSSTNSNIRIPFRLAQYSIALALLLTIDASNTNWNPAGSYYLLVNNVSDVRGNVIAPGSRIAVSWLQTMSVIRDNYSWRFHNSWIFDPDPITTNWYACDFVEGPWWADGHGCFYFGPSQQITFCGGTAVTTPTGFQTEPVLFRTRFHWPTNSPFSNVVIRPRFSVDDGAVFYLNGVEIARYNMPGGPINSTTRAATIIGPPDNCITSASWPVSNLVSGTNCFAVGIFQAANASDADIFFCFELDVDYVIAPVLPTEPEPTLAITPLATDRVRLSWTGGGYVLESATNLSFGAASDPFGPWQRVTNLSNPYTNNLSDPARFFRLKK